MIGYFTPKSLIKKSVRLVSSLIFGSSIYPFGWADNHKQEWYCKRMSGHRLGFKKSVGCLYKMFFCLHFASPAYHKSGVLCKAFIQFQLIFNSGRFREKSISVFSEYKCIGQMFFLFLFESERTAFVRASSSKRRYILPSFWSKWLLSLLFWVNPSPDWALWKSSCASKFMRSFYFQTMEA